MGVPRKTVVAAAAVVSVMLWTEPASATIAAGSTWYTDGSRSKTVHPGETIRVWASGAVPGVPYRLIVTEHIEGPLYAGHPCMAPVVQVVNPTLVYPGASGLIGTVRGVVTHNVPGLYELCFADALGDRQTATGGGFLVIAP